ncbi:hypothetical protein GCM10027436_35290 [Actinophytocola sediminis]
MPGVPGTGRELWTTERVVDNSGVQEATAVLLVVVLPADEVDFDGEDDDEEDDEEDDEDESEEDDDEVDSDLLADLVSDLLSDDDVVEEEAESDSDFAEVDVDSERLSLR